MISAVSGAALCGRLDRSDSDFWNRKPPAAWTPEEIEHLSKSPWAKEITPTYVSIPPATDRRPWSENPPIARGPVPRSQRSLKTPYQATIRWESAAPIRSAQKLDLPARLTPYHVIGVYLDNPIQRDLGAKPLDSLNESALLAGTREVYTRIVETHPEIPHGYLIGFYKTSIRAGKRIKFAARVGLLSLEANFDTRDMLSRGQLSV